MSRRRVLQVGALVWAAIAVAVALTSLNEVNADVRLPVGVASVAGPLAAVGASWLLGRESDRTAGVLLLLSVLTPTYFAWPLNVPALIAGIALLAAPGAVLPQHHRTAEREREHA